MIQPVCYFIQDEEVLNKSSIACEFGRRPNLRLKIFDF